jgi:hypothetical protein
MAVSAIKSSKKNLVAQRNDNLIGEIEIDADGNKLLTVKTIQMMITR